MPAHRRTTLRESSLRGALRSPESGSRRTMVAISSKSAIDEAMSSPLLGRVMAEVKMTMTPPGLMSRPAWRVGPSWIVFEALGKGPGVLSMSDIS